MEIIYKKLSEKKLFKDSHYFIGENRGVWCEIERKKHL